LREKKDFLSSLDALSLKGKRTMISGAASGIGRATSLRLAEAGSDLLLVDIDAKGLEKLKEELEPSNVGVRVFIADLSKEEEITGLWESLGGHIPSHLVNILGIYPSRNYLSTKKEFYDKVLCTNLHSVFWMCQNFIRQRIKNGGVIVNVSSIEAVTPFKQDMAHYIISKSGVFALTRSLAHDYGRKGFRINGVIPGVTKTPGISKVVKDSLRTIRVGLIKSGIDYMGRVSLGRLAEPDEIARVILFLCSDLSSYVHGVMIPVDGGFLCS
jgi:NAD(P)-dependent dehydrogenase (short-subunit alcohol dehydrogenase family)